MEKDERFGHYAVAYLGLAGTVPLASAAYDIAITKWIPKSEYGSALITARMVGVVKLAEN